MAENEDQVNQSRSVIIYRMGSVITAVGEYKVPHSLLWFPDYLSEPERLLRINDEIVLHARQAEIAG